MSKKSYINGLALLKNCQANLGWWLNTSHVKNLSKQGFELISKINNNLIKSITGFYPFKRPELSINIDNLIDHLIQLDPEAQAIDLRIIHNKPKNKKLNEGSVIKANPINITSNE